MILNVIVNEDVQSISKAKYSMLKESPVVSHAHVWIVEPTNGSRRQLADDTNVQKL